MSASAIRAGQAFYEILAHDKTQKGIDSAIKRLKSFGTHIAAFGASLSAAAAAGLAGFGAAIREFTAFGSLINDFSARTGVSTGWAQAFKVSAELAGASLSDVETAIRRMQKTLAKEGKMRGMAPEEQFLAVADSLLAISDPTLRAAKAMEMFGKSGTKILPMLEDLRKNFDFLQKNGLILSPEDIRIADELGDKWDLLNLTLAQSVRIIGAALAPEIIKLVEAATTITLMVVRFVQANRGLVIWAMGAVTVLSVLGAAITALGGTLFAAGVTLGFLNQAALFLLPLLPTIAAAIGAILSPIGLMIIAVGALLALLPILAYMIDAQFLGGAGLTMLSAGFQRLWSIASQTISGIANALMSGNWRLAASIGWQGILVAFYEGLAAAKAPFIDFFQWLTNALIDLFGSRVIEIVLSGLKGMIDLINNGLEAVGISSMQIGTEKLSGVLDSAKQGNQALKDHLAKGFNASREADRKRIQEAQGGLDVFTAQAKAEKEQLFQQKAAASGLPFDHGGEAKAMGVFSGAAAARLGQMQPQFTAIEEHLSEHTDLLKRIADNTEDGGAEFGD